MKIIEKMLNEGKNFMSVDAWSPMDSEFFHEVAIKGAGIHNIGDNEVRIEYRGGGGSGMGAYPAEYRVYIMKKIELKLPEDTTSSDKVQQSCEFFVDFGESLSSGPTSKILIVDIETDEILLDESINGALSGKIVLPTNDFCIITVDGKKIKLDPLPEVVTQAEEVISEEKSDEDILFKFLNDALEELKSRKN